MELHTRGMDFPLEYKGKMSIFVMTVLDDGI